MGLHDDIRDVRQALRFQSEAMQQAFQRIAVTAESAAPMDPPSWSVEDEDDPRASVEPGDVTIPWLTKTRDALHAAQEDQARRWHPATEGTWS